MATPAHLAYQQQSVQTASPERLLILLFDGAMRFLNAAQTYVQQKDHQNAHTQLIKAQDILRELMVTLNMDYEISHQLLPLYEYCQQRLIEANLHKEAGPIGEVLGLLTELRATFDQAARTLKAPGVAR